jgi:hypothetical protein
MEITANAGMDVRIVGGVFSGNLTATTNTATQNNMTDIYVIDSDFNIISLDDNFVKAHLLFCESLGSVDIQNGEIVGCYLGGIDIEDGPNVGTGDTVKIIGNVMSNLDIYNDDNYYMVMNNYINYNLTLRANHYSSIVNNIIVNNTISKNTTSAQFTLIAIYNNASVNYSNCHFFNNLMINTSSTGNGIDITEDGSGVPKFFYNGFYLSDRDECCTTPDFVTGNVSGGYNDAAEIILTLDEYGRTTHSEVVDKGMPSIEYYDIDMTINDIGAYGGPYSIDNYINNTSGKARIYDLDMPFEIWSGQTPTIKAKGAHTK